MSKLQDRVSGFVKAAEGAEEANLQTMLAMALLGGAGGASLGGLMGGRRGALAGGLGGAGLGAASAHPSVNLEALKGIYEGNPEIINAMLLGGGMGGIGGGLVGGASPTPYSPGFGFSERVRNALYGMLMGTGLGAAGGLGAGLGLRDSEESTLDPSKIASITKER
jgi:hypothetical protein